VSERDKEQSAPAAGSATKAADADLPVPVVDQPATFKEAFEGMSKRRAAREKRRAKEVALAARDAIVSARPVLPYDAKVALHICDLIAQGWTLQRIQDEPGMPSSRTILAWLHKHEDFSVLYDRAKEIRTEAFADEILAIADDTSKDVIERVTKNGTIVTAIDHECVNRSRLRVDSRRWLMSKDNAKRYGDQIAVAPASGLKATLIIEG